MKKDEKGTKQEDDNKESKKEKEVIKCALLQIFFVNFT